jgi:hypothetical protein
MSPGDAVVCLKGAHKGKRGLVTKLIHGNGESALLPLMIDIRLGSSHNHMKINATPISNWEKIERKRSNPPPHGKEQNGLEEQPEKDLQI